MQPSHKNWFKPRTGIFPSSALDRKEMFINENGGRRAYKQTENATVLVVNDGLVLPYDFSQILEAEGFKVLTATDSETALRLIEQNRCELILLNAELSEISGLALCKLLRADRATSDLPIIIFSDNSEESYIEEVFQCGADDFFVVPFIKQDIVRRLRFHLENSRKNRLLNERNRELGFLADLGRSLLMTLAPEEVVSRVAGATYEATEAVLCAVIADMVEVEPLVCVFNREGSAENKNEIKDEKIVEWLKNSNRTEPLLLENSAHFLLTDKEHKVEYISPLVVNGKTKGALIVGFDRLRDCSETVRRLVDAAASLASMSVHISSLYDAALDASVYIAKEEQKRFTEAILDALPVSLYAVDRDFKIVAWNRHRELGLQGIPRESVIGCNIFQVLTRQPREMLELEFEKAFRTGKIERIEQRTTDENGVMKHWLVSKVPMRDQITGEVTHVITVGEDITGRVEANHAVARAEKLAAVGRLAAGVVHEINNPLATIAACAEALSNRVQENAFGESPEVEDLRDYLQLIKSEAFRCKSITNGLLDFSRSGASGNRTQVNVVDVVKSSLNLVSHQKRGQNVEVKTEFAERLPYIKADAGQLQQAVIILATNAIDAMPDGGKLTLRVFQEKQRILIEVEDTGIGIPPENLMKIYEPFFTTKEVGKGTGLGLAVCYGIVTEQGGTLNVRSTVGTGTTFTITLPIKNAKKNSDF